MFKLYFTLSDVLSVKLNLAWQRLKCVTGYAKMSNDLTDCLDFDYQQTRDPTDRVTYLFIFFLFFFNVPFSLFLGNSLLDFEMGKVKVFFFYVLLLFFVLEILPIFLFFIFYVLFCFLLFFVLEILLIFLFFIFLGTASLNLEMGK